MEYCTAELLSSGLSLGPCRAVLVTRKYYNIVTFCMVAFLLTPSVVLFCCILLCDRLFCLVARPTHSTCNDRGPEVRELLCKIEADLGKHYGHMVTKTMSYSKTLRLRRKFFAP